MNLKKADPELWLRGLQSALTFRASKDLLNKEFLRLIIAIFVHTCLVYLPFSPQGVAVLV